MLFFPVAAALLHCKKDINISSVEGITFGLNQVIQGWTMGIPFFKEGGRGKLLIPSGLAYGSSPRNGIPANSVLIFDMLLLWCILRKMISYFQTLWNLKGIV